MPISLLAGAMMDLKAWNYPLFKTKNVELILKHYYYSSTYIVEKIIT